MAQQKAASAPVADEQEEQQAAQQFVEVSPGVASPELPLVPNARVVYLGAARNKSVPMVGRLFYEEDEGEDGVKVMVNKAPNMEGGITSYDFSTHDIKGRIIKQRMVPAASGYPGDLVGKPMTVCEHPEHLRRFLRMKDRNNTKEFRVLVEPQYRDDFEHFVRAREAALKLQEKETAETAS